MLFWACLWFWVELSMGIKTGHWFLVFAQGTVFTIGACASALGILFITVIHDDDPHLHEQKLFQKFAWNTLTASDHFHLIKWKTKGNAKLLKLWRFPEILMHDALLILKSVTASLCFIYLLI